MSAVWRGPVIKASVVLTNLSHTWPSDIDALLNSPSQQSSLIMANAGASYAIRKVSP